MDFETERKLNQKNIDQLVKEKIKELEERAKKIAREHERYAIKMPEGFVGIRSILADTPAMFPPPACKHEFVNVSFNHLTMACKFCGDPE